MSLEIHVNRKYIKDITTKFKASKHKNYRPCNWNKVMIFKMMVI